MRFFAQVLLRDVASCLLVGVPLDHYVVDSGQVRLPALPAGRIPLAALTGAGRRECARYGPSRRS